MTPDGNQILGVALSTMWATAGGVWLYKKTKNSPTTKRLAAEFRRLNRAWKSVVVVGTAALVVEGGLKTPNTVPSRIQARHATIEAVVADVPFALTDANTNFTFLARSEESIVSRDGLLLGASESGEWIEFDHPVFTFGTNEVSRIYASPGVLSFETKRHPALDSTLPYGDNVKSLVALRMPLGLVPQANWQYLSAQCRFWHEETSSGVVFTWENILLDRQADQPATVQIELEKSGAFTYRYDFSRAAPTNSFLIGAQYTGTAVTALRIAGVSPAITNSATVYRVQGASVPAGVSVSDLLAASSTLELRWENVSDLGDLSGDTDGDGLTDWDEIHLYGTDPHHADTDGDGLSDLAEILAGTNPLDADEDGDGVPDGVDEDEWAANPLWATPGDGDVEIRLNTAIPAGATATLVIGSLPIPLRAPASYPLELPAGEEVPFRLFSHGVRGVDLSIGRPTPAIAPTSLKSKPKIEFSGYPFYLFDPKEIFQGGQMAADGFFARPTAFLQLESGDDDMITGCIHGNGHCVYSVVVRPMGLTLSLDDATVVGFTREGTDRVSLTVGNTQNDSAYGFLSFGPPALTWGELWASRSIHRCELGPLDYCHFCDLYHTPGSTNECPHPISCPSRTNELSDCTCPIPVVRVTDSHTNASEFATIVFPSGRVCPDMPDVEPPYVKITKIDSPLHVTNATAGATISAGDHVSGSALVWAGATSGSKPWELEYDVVHTVLDENGTKANKVTRHHTQKIWAVALQHEPITTETENGYSINPSGIVRGQTAVFRFNVTPANFPTNLITWKAEPANRVEFVGGNHGPRVVVRGKNLGDVTLTAEIAGFAGPQPICKARITDRKVIKADAWILGQYGIFARSENEVYDLFADANKILAQVGVEISLDSINFTNHVGWVDFDPKENNWRVPNQIASITNGTGGLVYYFVGNMYHYFGLHSDGDILIKNTASGQTVAHEACHAFGLPDIYASDRDSLSLFVPIDLKPCYTNLPSDWGTTFEEGFYSPSLTHSNLITRLLMYGSDDTGMDSGADLPTGDIFGLWYGRAADTAEKDWHLSEAPAGFFQRANLTPFLK